MKTIEELLRNLARPEVLEFGLVTQRLPSVNIGGKFEPVDDEAPTTERLVQMLVAMGGGRHIDSLTDKPVQWTTRLEGVGVIAVAAIMRKDVVQARFTVAKREAAAPARPSQPIQRTPESRASAPALTTATQASITPNHQSGSVAVQKAGSIPVHPGQPPLPRAHPSSQSMLALRQAAQLQAQPMKAPLPSSAPMRAASVPAPAIATAPPLVTHSQLPPPVPPSPPEEVARSSALSFDEEDDEDDDEPTLQTLSPPVAGAPGRGKAARKREGNEPAEAAEEPRPEAAAPERGPPQQVAEARARLEEVERQARERAAAQQDALAKGPMRRILTPTSVDAVEIEHALAAKAAQAAQALRRPSPLDINLDGDVPEPQKKPPEAPEKKEARAPAETPAEPAHDAAAAANRPAPITTKNPSRPVTLPLASAIPSTVPTTDKDRPRVDGSAALDFFLAMAVAARASDLFVVAARPVLLRVATELLPRTQPVSPEHVERMLKEIVPPRLRDTFDREGACDFALEHPAHGRFRVNASRQRGGCKLNLRVIPRELPTVAGLGLPDTLSAALRHQRGLILVTGPAASGKSTAIAALVDHLNRETQKHIVTIEAPIEHIHPRKKGLVSQREVGLHARSKTRAIEAALREDADVLVISDLRDVETMRLALTAVESGRLVVAVTGASGATAAIDRLLDLFSGSELVWARTVLASSLRMVVGLRLLPSADCTRLHAAAEVLPWSPALDAALRDPRGEPISRVRPPFTLRIDDAVEELVRAQKITTEVAKQFAESPSDLESPAARSTALAPRKS